MSVERSDYRRRWSAPVRHFVASLFRPPRRPLDIPFGDVLRAIATGDSLEVERTQLPELVRNMAALVHQEKVGTRLLFVKGAFVDSDPFFRRNRDFCRALLQQGIEGSKDAQREYEARRITMCAKVPTYALNIVHDLCTGRLQSLKKAGLRTILLHSADGPQFQDSGQQVKSSLMKYIDSITAAGRDSVLGELGLPGALTFRLGSLAIAELEERRTKGGANNAAMFGATAAGTGDELDSEGYRTAVRIKRLDGGHLIVDQFTPAAEGPIARCAADCFKGGLKLLLKATILEDLLADLPLSVPDSVKRATLERVEDPWALGESSLVKNALYLSELFESGLISPDTLESFELRNRLLLKDPSKEIEGLEDAARRKKERAEAKQKEERANDLAKPAVRDGRGDGEGHTGGLPSSREHKANFFNAIQVGLTEVVGDPAVFRGKYRQLYALYLRGLMTLGECVDAVKTGESGQAISERIRKQLRDKDAVPSRLRMPPPERADTGVAAVATSEPERSIGYRIEGKDAQFFSKWFAGLDEKLQNLVTKRLKAAEERGVLYDCHSLGDRRLLEFCFHGGKGHRLYFCVPKAGTILLLGAGPHDLQTVIVDQLAPKVGEIIKEWRLAHPGELDA